MAGIDRVVSRGPKSIQGACVGASRLWRQSPLFIAALLAGIVLLCAIAPSAMALSLGVQWTGNYDDANNEMGIVGKSGATLFRLPVSPDRSGNGSNWEYYDSVFGHAAENGVTILPHLSGRLNEQVGLPSSSEKGAWEEWAKTAVRRYGYNGIYWSTHPNVPAKPVIAWELWNEPNNKELNGVKIEGTEYGEFLAWAGPAVQGASESWGKHTTGVLFGGLLGWSGQTEYQTFLKNAYNAKGASSAFTGFAFHPYELDVAAGSRIEVFKTAVNGARSYLNGLGASDKSLWITETGWPAAAEYSGGEVEQAKLLTEAVDWAKGNAASLNLQALIWYNYRDHGPNIWQYRSGLRDESGKYRLSWFAFQKEAGAATWPIEPPIQGEDDNLPGPHMVVQSNGSIDAFFRTPSGTLGHAWTQGGTWSEQDIAGTSINTASVPHPIVKANGQIDVFWRTPSGGLGHAWNDATGWHTDTLLGSLSTDPHPALQENGTIDVLFRNTNGELGHDWYQPGGEWHGNIVPGSVASDPYSVAQNNGTVDTFFRTPSGGLGHAWTQGGSWSEQDLGGTSIASSSTPHPVLKASGQVDVFWRTPSNGLGHAWDDAGGWHVETLAGSLGSEPHPILAPSGVIDVFYRTSSGGLGHNWYQPGSQWFSEILGGSLASDPYPVVQPRGAIDIFWQAPGSQFGHAWDDATGWHTNVLPGVPASIPHAVAQTNGTIDVLYRTTSGGLGHDWYQAGGEWQANSLPGSLALGAPKATTAAASSVQVTSAILNGTVNPEGSATSYYFEYGTTTSYGSKKPISAEALGSGQADIAVSQTASGLTEGATYHYRVAAEGPAGTSYGADKSFTTLIAATTTTTATVIQVLNGAPGWVSVGGNVNGTGVNGAHVDIRFEKWENSQWVYKGSVSPQPTVAGNYYEAQNWQLARGLWRTKTVLEPQGTLKGSESSYHEFEIKGGYQLVARHSGKCLDVYAAEVRNGTQMIQYECGNPATSTNQVFTLVPQGGGYYQLVPRHSGKCVDVPNSSQADGTQLQQWECIGPGQANQLWKAVPYGPTGYYHLVAKHSSKCMDVWGAEQKNVAAVIQWACGEGQNQQWQLKSVEISGGEGEGR